MEKNKIKYFALVLLLFISSSAVSNDSGWVVSIDPIPPSDYNCIYTQGIEIDGKPIPCRQKKQHDLNRFCSRGGIDGTDNHWKVSKEMRNIIDKKLEQLFKEQNNQLNFSKPDDSSKESTSTKLDSHYRFEGYSDFNLYARQYLGFHSDGKKQVYINAYKINKESKVSENHIFLTRSCHGGKRFWGIVYDIKSNTFEGLSFNNFGPPVK